jgi:pimeloyl-ACP methyl ester carboxylesterase
LPRSVVSTTLSGADDARVAALRAESAAPDSSAPAVVLVHGFTGSKEDFVRLLPLLSGAGIDAVAIDLPGQHESAEARLQSDDPVDGLAEQVAAVVDAVGATRRPVHLVGHSFGGIVARRAVLDHDAQVGSFTLLSSGPAALADASQRRTLEAFIGAMQAGMIDAVWEHMRAEKLAADPRLAPEVLAFLEQRLRNGSAGTHAAIARGLLDEADRTAELASHPTPVHVAYGVDDDIWTPDIQHGMASRLGVHATPIAAAGHSPAMDAPDATAALLIAATETGPVRR